MANNIWEQSKPVGKDIWDKSKTTSEVVWEKSKSTDSDLGLEKDFSQMSKFGKVIDIIGRPGYAFKSAVAERISQKQPLNIMDIVARAGLPQNIPMQIAYQFAAAPQAKPEQQQAIFEAAKRGFTGQERLTGSDVMGRAGISGIPGLGFATELALDPLMYGGYGAITKGISKGLGATGKLAMKVPAISKSMEVAHKRVQPVVSWLSDKFINKTGIKELGDLIDKHLMKREYLKGQEMKFGIKVRNTIQNVSQRYGISIDDVEKQIINFIEQPNIIPKGLPQESVAIANTLRSHLTSMLTAELKAGVPITSLSQGSRAIQYFPRITSNEAVKYLTQAKKSYPRVSSKVWDVMLANAKARKTVDFTLAEFNDFVASYGLKSLGGKSIEQFFLQKPATAVAIRGIRSAKAITSAEFLDDVGKQFGQKQAPSWFVELPESAIRMNKNLKGLKFDPEVFNEVTRTFKSYINPQELGNARKTFDYVQNMWKQWTLAPFPKYHLRNMVGNLWNNHLAGVGLSSYPKAQAVQLYRKYKGTGGSLERTALLELRKMGISTQKADDIIRLGEEFQVLGRGWYGADIETTMEQTMRQGFFAQPLNIKLKKLFIPGKEHILTEKGMAVGTTIENNARLAHFIDKLDKGEDVLSASQSVKKFLFDYQDLTQFEKEVMKRAFPFYTWTRKNIPLQLEQLWKQPQKFAQVSPLVRNRDPQQLLQLKYAIPQVYERLPIEIRQDADTITYVPLEGLLPVGDLSKLVRPQEIFLELLSPFIRNPLEMAFNKSLYFESEIQKYDNETQELLKMDIPVRLKYHLTTILPQARMVNEVNKLIKKNVRKEELTLAEQAFSQTLSTVYKMNLKDLKDRASMVIEDKIRDLENGLRRAKLYERGAEVGRIRKTYEQIREEMRRIRQ